jgi:superfamily I DNA/RNA helicase
LQVLEISKIKDPLNRISFNDQVWLPVAMNWTHGLYDLVIVDECQDMNVPQLRMAQRLVHKGGRICCIGDDWQAIYGFRGAAEDGLKMMEQDLKAGKLGLTITRRCPKKVVALAQALVPDYKAADDAPEGEVLYIGDSMLPSSMQVGDAILSRTNAPLMPICLQLLRAGVPARIEGRDVGKQLLGIVSSLRAKSIPHFLKQLVAWGNKQRARCKNGKHAESRLSLIDDQVETLSAIAEGLSGIGEINARIKNLFQDSDGFSKPAVVLSSVHKAKGLEWNRVCLLSKTFKVTSGQGEEARIYYVALTRSKNTLVFVSEEKPNNQDN